MNLDELCICGDTYEVHFGGACTHIGRRGVPCDCKQFVSCEYSVQIFNTLKYVVDCAKLQGQTFDPAMGQSLATAEALIDSLSSLKQKPVITAA